MTDQSTLCFGTVRGTLDAAAGLLEERQQLGIRGGAAERDALLHNVLTEASAPAAVVSVQCGINAKRQHRHFASTEGSRQHQHLVETGGMLAHGKSEIAQRLRQLASDQRVMEEKRQAARK